MLTFDCGPLETPGRAVPRSRLLRTVGCAVVALWIAFALLERTDAAPPGAASDRQTREEAIRAIPFDRLNEQAQSKVWSVVGDPSLYRRLPAQMIDADPDMYLFLIRYPEVMVNMWQLMDVTKVTMQRTAPYVFNASDGQGTASTAELLYGTPELHIFYAEGQYEGPLLKRLLRGKCVLVLASGYSRGPDQRLYVSNRMDVFVHIDNAGAELVAKTLTPLFGQSTDTNFAESLKFISQVSRAAERNGPGVQQVVPKLTNCDPAVRDQFSRLTNALHQRAAGTPVIEARNASNPRP